MRVGKWSLVVTLLVALGCGPEASEPRTPRSPGYPPQQPGYPPQQPGGYGQPGYGPQQPGYPPQQPGYAGPQQPQQPGYPPQQPGYPPQQPGGNQPPPGQPSAPSNPRGQASPPPAPMGSFDASGRLTQQFIRQEAHRVLTALVAALPPEAQKRVQGIPLAVLDDDPREVNAFAGCDKAGHAFMAITGGLLTIQASSSEAKAYDELHGTKEYDKYLSQVASDVRARRAVRGMQPGALPLPGALDPRKLARQRWLFDEQVAFALGHELAHHYRGHTGCANGIPSDRVTAQTVGRVMARAVPIFNQPMEVEADVNGVRNVLNAGMKQPAPGWNEEGALMTLGFFDKLSGFGPEVLLLGFIQSHPPPAIRIPIVRNEAAAWHRQHGGTPAGGQQAPSSPGGWKLPIPIPGFGG